MCPDSMSWPFQEEHCSSVPVLV